MPIDQLRAGASYLLDERERDQRIREIELSKPLAFAYGRLRLVNAVLAFDNGGPCRTDDGFIYSDLMLPYAVEISHLNPEANFDAAMRRFQYWLPKHVAELGRAGMAAQWDSLCETRSVVANQRRAESEVGNVQWLPTAAKICDELQLTHARRAAINALYPDRPPIRGVGVIDPLTDDEKREHECQRKRNWRRANGVQPQASRTKTADDKVLAKAIGCDPRTIRRHRAAGTLDAYLTAKGLDVQKVSARYILENGPGQILDTPQDEAGEYVEAMAMFRGIAADPYAWAWGDELMVS